jgi:hypothetical protein
LLVDTATTGKRLAAIKLKHPDHCNQYPALLPSLNYRALTNERWVVYALEFFI